MHEGGAHECSVSIVIPVFNNSGSLLALFERIEQAMSDWSPEEWEVVFVDDGSQDDSWERLIEIHERHASVVLLRLGRNVGQRIAIRAGWSRASGRRIVTMSADLQDPPELIPELLVECGLKTSLVVASRIKRHDSWSYRLPAQIVQSVYSKVIPGYPPGGFDFYAVSSDIVRLVLPRKDKTVFLQGELLRLASSVRYVDYDRERRIHGKSQQPWHRLWSKPFVDLFSLFAWPAYAFLILAGATLVISILYAMWVLVSFSLNRTPFQGWTPLILLTLVFGSLMLAGVSVVILLLHRMIQMLDNKPIYTVENEVR